MTVTTPAMAAAFRLLTSGATVRTHQRDPLPGDSKAKIEDWKAERIDALRLRKLSHRQIADVVGVSKTTVANYLAE